MKKAIFASAFLFLCILPAKAQIWMDLAKTGQSLLGAQKFREADSVFNEVLVLVRQDLGEDHIYYANALLMLYLVNYSQGNYDQALFYMEKSHRICERVLDKAHFYYAGSCNNLANAYKSKGFYDKAETLYVEAKNIREQVLGKSDSDYAQSCNNLAGLYRKQGLYDKAEPLYIEAKNIREQALGKKHPDYAGSCNNLAILYSDQKLYSKAEPLYIEAKNIREEALGKKHSDYAASCNNLALLYQNQGMYDKAELLFLEAQGIREQVFGKRHPLYAQSRSNLAILYELKGLYSKAELLYLEAKSIYEQVFGKAHPFYAGACSNLAGLYSRQKLYAKAMSLHAEAIDYNTKQINILLPTLSEKERSAYLQSIYVYFLNFQVFAITYHKENPKIAAELYNQNLFTKSLVFASTQKMRNQILNSGDSVLINDFESWREQKDSYNKLIQKSKKEQEQSGIDLTKMAADINELERSLSKRSVLFSENVQAKTYKWQQVKDKLGRKEAVVEIIRARKTVGYDSLGENILHPVYIALFVTPQTKGQPEMLVLENGDELEAKYLNYYRKAIEFQIEDRNSYSQYWKPIADKLNELRKKGFDKVYFSPDGVYHQINLNTLKDPETGEFLLERQPIQLIGTSRDLIEFSTSKIDLSQNFEDYKAYLLGYPTYNLETGGKQVEGKDRSFSPLQRTVGRGGPVGVLPGTKAETEAVRGYFTQKSIASTLLLEAEASEENIKKVKSPTILHIATHGFFIPPMKDSEVATMQDAMSRNLLENPFMRSGLLLAGCETPNPEGEDGVLTSAEAMNLSLENTQLVVLSACETGLGDIQYGEGVFGLQRAFQQAGAKTILMSLWKVSDEATQLLMSEFYRGLLAGKSKREAFRASQLALKRKYPEPYYWGAFVMVGE